MAKVSICSYWDIVKVTGGFNIIFAEKGPDESDDVNQYLSFGLSIHNLQDDGSKYIDQRMGEGSSLAIITNNRTDSEGVTRVYNRIEGKPRQSVKSQELKTI